MVPQESTYSSPIKVFWTLPLDVIWNLNMQPIQNLCALSCHAKVTFNPENVAFISILITINALCLKSNGGHRAHCMARRYLPRRQALSCTCFGSQSPTTGNSMSHMWAPGLLLSLYVELCHCQLWFYLFCCLHFIIIYLQTMREGLSSKKIPKIGKRRLWKHSLTGVFVQAMQRSRIRVLGFSCSCLLSLIAFNTNCCSTQVWEVLCTRKLGCIKWWGDFFSFALYNFSLLLKFVCNRGSRTCQGEHNICACNSNQTKQSSPQCNCYRFGKVSS